MPVAGDEDDLRPLITCSFRLTEADYQQAITAYHAPTGNRAERRPKERWSLGIVIAFAVAVAVFIFTTFPAADRAETLSALARKLLIFGPLLLYFILITLTHALRVASAASQRWITLSSIASFGTVFLIHFSFGRDDKEVSDAVATMLLPSYVVLIMLWAHTTKAYAPTEIRQAWATQPQLHRAKSASVFAEHIIISSDLDKLTYRWPSFNWFQETSDLYLLGQSPYLFHIIPKRGFESVALAERFAALVREKTDHRSYGFPVVSPPST